MSSWLMKLKQNCLALVTIVTFRGKQGETSKMSNDDILQVLTDLF